MPAEVSPGVQQQAHGASLTGERRSVDQLLGKAVWQAVESHDVVTGVQVPAGRKAVN
ncbi:hypothetical protein ACFWB3_17500 [[Kitasatospora] papulosa]|uniref:hypothetical protein n=1 Tax=[Kitasatospora] papulosa TaxID=1464011 RepID=UPI0036BD1E44